MTRAAPRLGNLPAEATSFVGRRSELAELKKKLATARLVSLVGPGGVGKTRLAIRVARALARGVRDGAWLVGLAELRDPALVSNVVLAALDLRDQAGAEPRALLRSYLRDKELLLVLDNCEHLLDASAQLAADILAAAPGLRIVATSREPLSITGEHVLPLPPLELPAPQEPLERLRLNETVLLFVERAAAASGGFELTEANGTAVVDLCRRLDGLPLAIELAAVRTRALSLQQIRDRLTDRFALLTGGSRAALPRHQTLRTTLEWSYDLLTPQERGLLARLSVFAGRFALPDVEVVCATTELPAADVLDVLSSLLEKSLVVKDDLDGEPWYRMHETMRDFASLKLREADGEDEVRRRCAGYYLSRCGLFAAEGRYRLLDWLPWIELEIDNVRAVLRSSMNERDDAVSLGLVTSLIWYWITRATSEGVAWVDELLGQVPAQGVPPWTYFLRGFLGVLQNEPSAAAPALDRGVSAARIAGQPPVLVQTLAMASIAATQAGDLAASRRLLDEARSSADGVDDLGAALMLHQAQSLGGILTGDLDAARRGAAAGERLSRDAGDLYSLEMMLLNHALAALAAGRLRECEGRCTEALGIARQLDDRVAQCYLLGALACCAAGTRDARRAARLLGATENLRAETGATIHAGLAPALAHTTTSTRQVLGSARFESDVEAGRGLDRDDVLRFALRESEATKKSAHPTTAEGLLGRRERDVAWLVADGLTNREIGARLFISERTVESHVRNILTKLGFTSRAQIASWMATQER